MMSKSELLRSLVEEYSKSIRLADDISLRDYKDAVERETGKRISDKKAMRLLNGRPDLEALLVSGPGGEIWIWRERRKQKDAKRRNKQTGRTLPRATAR